MGVSTDGSICFGVLFKEGQIFPWDVSEEEESGWGDIEEWWRKVNGYKPPFELYDETGQYKDGRKPTEIELEAYYEAERKWDKKHPIPVQLVNYCSGEFPMYILAVPSSYVIASRGYPESFEPKDLKVATEDIGVLLKFIGDHIKPIRGTKIKPQWYLSSCYSG